MEETIAALFQRALGLHQQGQLPAAEALYANILQREPRHADTLHLLGVMASQVKKHPIALDLMSQAIAVNPRAPLYFCNRGNVYKDLRQFDAALRDFDAAISLQADHADAHFSRGFVLQQLHRLPEALASYDRAIASAPRHGGMHYSRGVVLQKLGRLDEALAAYDVAIDLRPDHAETHSNRGVVLKELKRLAAAVASFDRAIALRPDFADAYSNRGNALLELREVEAAVHSFDQAIALRPQFAMAYSNRGNALKELRQFEAAVDSYRMAASIDPQFAQAIFNTGIALQELKRYDEALVQFDQADSPRSRAEALLCLHALEQHDAFFSRLAQYAVSDPENIGIASLATFVAQQTGRANPYPFCKDPLDFLHFSNVAGHEAAPEAFLDGLIAELTARDLVLNPLNNITKNGYQSSSDLFSARSGHLLRLRQIVEAELEKYQAAFLGAPDLMMEKFPRGRNFEAWFIRLRRQGHLEPHIHTEGWISGVIYLQVVPTMEKDEGAIEFSLCGAGYKVLDPNFPRHVHRPQRGDIVIFPSSLQHKTIPFSTDTERMIVSFDLRRDNPSPA